MVAILRGNVQQGGFVFGQYGDHGWIANDVQTVVSNLVKSFRLKVSSKVSVKPV